MIAERDIDALGSLWETDLEAAYKLYAAALVAECSDPQTAGSVALAAALVETAIAIQRLAAGIAPPADLLRGDLCLARASRLLADVGNQGLQIEFARIIERAAAHAAAGSPMEPIRERLLTCLRSRSVEQR